MHHHHHHQQQQQQLAALLSAALPEASSSSTAASSSSAPPAALEGERPRDQDRVAALNSLHRAIVYPPNSLLVAHSAPFLSQGLFQLLSDQSYSVRRAASVAYGSLCSVVCSTSLTPNGRQNPVIASGLVDRFIAWALPLVRNVGVGNGLAELALEGLREFLTNGDATSTERYVLPILKSCQELLEDERTSLNLLHRLLGMLSLISVKYWHCFQPHFVDIIDLLLGWALVPDLPESERGIIMDTFLQFKNHWTSNLQISIRLLSKFLGDMEVLIQDGGLESAPQLGRLLALFSCFSTVLQAATFGALETNLLKQMCEPLESMVPRLLGCLSTVGEKSGWEKWTKEFWKCLSFVTEILQERFSNFYLTVIDILFQILKVLPASQVPGVLKANLQMLSLQKLALLPSSVQKLLQLNMPFSLLRLHPNHTVVVSVSATYLFLLRHNSNELVSQAITSVMQELEVLINKLKKGHRSQVDYGEVSHLMANQLNLGSEFLEKCSESELISLIKFDLKILLCSVSIGSDGNVPDHLNSATFCNERSGLLATFICEKLDPFESPIQDLLELQIHVLRTMHKLSEAEFLSRLAFYKNSRTEASNHGNDEIQRRLEERPAPPAVIFECLNKYNGYIIRSLSVSSPVAIKIEALDWVASFCDAIIDINKDLNLISDICEPCQPVNISSSLLFVVLDAASDREIKVRSNVASVLEKLIQARIIYPGNFYLVAEASLERLGDPDIAIKNAFVRLLTIVLPIAFFRCGIFEDWISFSHSGSIRIGNKDFLNWKQILAVKQLPRQLDSQQLVSILGYISQRWKTPLSTWIQRLVFSCSVTNATLSLLKEDARYLGSDALSIDDKTTETLLEKICPVNNLAAVWWSIHEAARYSVNLRLRTNLGGPTQTFAALERMLLDIAHVLLLDAEQTDSNISIGASNIHLLPMRLLLDFVESLKKHVYNAYEGSSVLPRATRQSSLFFRANKKVCEEWFSRICEPMLNAGLALQCHDAVLHYSALRLQDLQTLMLSLKEKIRGTVISENLQNFRVKLVVDVLKVMRHAALALCRSREPEALVGLHNWVQVTFSSLFVEDCQTDLGNDRNSGYFSWITGLVYQAQGQHEKAAAHFSHLLQSEEVLASMGSEGIQFVIARVIESYSSISDWKSLELWLSELQALRAKHAGKSYSGALTAAGNEINVVHALARFDEGDIQAAWAYLDLTPKSSNELTLDPKLALERSEQMLLRAMLQKDEKMDKVPDELGKAKLMLDEVLSVAPLDGLSEVASYAGQLHCVFAFEEGLKLECQRGFLQLPPMLSSLCQVLDFPISKVHQDPSLWLKLFRVYRTILPTSPFTLMLCQKLISLARKQSNFMLAERMVKNLRDNISKSNHGAFSDLLLADLQYESVLLNYAQGKHEDALFSIWMLVRNCILFPATIASESYKMVKAKACLKLSTWLKQEYCDTLLANVLHKVHADIIESDTIGTPFIKNGHSSSDKNSVSDSNRKVFLEEIVGMSVKSSCHLCPTMGKTWLSYATWCYNQARSSFSPHDAFLQSCSLSPILVPEFPSDRFHLTEEEVSNVRTIITNFFLSKGHGTAENEGDMDEADLLLNQRSESLVSSFIQQSISLIESLAGAPGVESFSGECPSSALASQLQMLFSHPNAQMPKYDVLTCIDQLVEVWWLIRRRRVSLFGHAACSYLRYLSCSSSKIEEYPGVNHNHDFAREKSGSCTLKAALYILHIILNYGAELRETIEPGLASVPMLPWQEITPQLFARLTSHPQREVRGQLEGILMMLGKQSPWSIVYPTLVDINNFEGVPSEELQRLLNFLAKLYPQLIKDVQLVINELGNMTVLWEEQWLSTLQDLHSDVIRRINMLKEEAKRIAENATLSQSEKNKINSAKYSAMMAPIVVALERRLASTSREPETPHEEWFQREYGEQLKNAISTFRTPPLSPLALGEVWRPFDAIATSLVNYQRKSLISLSEVAPWLAKLSSSEIPMPGLEKHISLRDSTGSSTGDLQGLVTISAFLEQVTILSTKTKPKKIAILGSDGQKYTYLLKGREDLRLDARIMQLLQAVNGFLFSCADTRSRSLAVRYYSVTPISGRAGLIQWVDNVTSIYTVFKSWQQRNQLAQMSANGGGNMDKTVPAVPRPGDMFYGKIIPALKEKGIKRVISRRDWPQEVKRKVLQELMREIPKQLLRQEIWCASEGFKAFSLKSKRFSSSMAAMSMVGHILGLGDRHLDNILMDFSSGDVVHIDYNVCFDKGRRLKIPEIVPFRLTQTIEAALGLTGVEGTFKANCEAVASVLRRNKDVLLMMLEVFVWDPLVEWTRGDMHDEAAIGGEEKKGMELAVSLSLFASRFQEIRVPLQEHHDSLVTTLPSAEIALKKFLGVLNQYEIVSTIFYHADQERSNLLQCETSAKSAVAEATSISEKARASYEVQCHEFAQAKAAAADKAQEAAKWIEQHGRVLDALQNGSFPNVHALVRFSGMEEAISLIPAVVVAGVPLTIVPEPTQAQCYDLDREVSEYLVELDTGLSLAVEALQEYSMALQRVLPLNYITTSPVNGWAQALQLSVTNLSSEVLSLARQQAAELVKKAQGDTFDSVQQKHGDLFLNIEKYLTEIEKVKDECAELTNSIGTDSETKSKDRLLSSFLNFLQSAGILRKEDDGSVVHITKHDFGKDVKVEGDLEEKKVEIFAIIYSAATALFQVVKGRVLDISHDAFERIGWRRGYHAFQPMSETIFHEFVEQVEKCALVSGFVDELQQLVGFTPTHEISGTKEASSSSGGNWASIFQASLHSCKLLVDQMTELVLPEIIKSAISYHTEVMEAFGSMSQIRGSTDTALEQLVELELERTSLMELEKNYFVRVGLITEQRLALEEAAMKGRDHLSWEEAEELASQEESCREQLDKLHHTWNQRDMHNASLTKKEANIRLSLISSERHFSSLINIEQGGELHISRSKVLLAMLVNPFSEMESIDQLLPSYETISSDTNLTVLADFRSSGYSQSESIWKFARLLKNHSFFLWKIGVIDSILDACIHDISSFVDHNLGFDQLYNVLKKKLEIQLQEHVGQYLRDRVAPAFLVSLETESDHLHQLNEAKVDFYQARKSSEAVRKVQNMLEEYCNAHETARAAVSAVSVLKRQGTELTEALRKSILEVVQMEWLYDHALPHLSKRMVLSQDIFNDDRLHSLILGLNRSKMLEHLQNSMSSIAKSIECIKSSERTSVSAEAQLERAMGWACAGPNITSSSNTTAKSSGIPSEFHDHLLRRRQLLWAAQEQASSIMNICKSVMEFEASRDGLFRIPGEIAAGRPTGDGRTWQQVYMNALTRLDITYHSFKRTEQEWKVAQNNMETAGKSLISATNELSIASTKAYSASGELQDTLAAMKDCAYEASLALSAFSRVAKGQTALTSECGSMLEEVLAIAEGLHDVNNLGKEAATVHGAFMTDLSKVNMILLPLESSLSSDIAAIFDAISREEESSFGLPSRHGQAIYKSYFFKVRESCQSLRPLVPSITSSANELHAMLIKLARTASMHAGNLHKALEGLGESQVLRSQDLNLSRSQLANASVSYGDKQENGISDSQGDVMEDLPSLEEFSLQEDGWISPPDIIYSSSLDSSVLSTESSVSESSDKAGEYPNLSPVGDFPESFSSIQLNCDDGGAPVKQSDSRSEEADDADIRSPDAATSMELTEHMQALTLHSSAGSITTNPDNLCNTDKERSKDIKLSDDKNEIAMLHQDKGRGSSHDDSSIHITRGKNAYAMSVLRQVEMKIDGRDVDESRPMSISEQVDHLIKQATSIDNLCNMYEGWTPWI